ncbi:MAG: WbqC family protein [Rikenellaceae bacterium]|nr:WbqC family protein [Rikenellaceae bacterium]
MSSRTILPLTYLGNVQWFAHLLVDDCVIDLGERYLKQSYRNRTVIAAANGLQPLTVQVANANRPRMLMRDVRIDYSKRWQHQHWVSILSAYKSSPYFDFYGEEFAPFFERRYDFLIDWNADLCRTAMRALGIGKELITSEKWISADEAATAFDHDLRGAFSPKPRLAMADERFTPQPYCQVFADRAPFAPNLSILDLLFCEGPSATTILRSCLR